MEKISSIEQLDALSAKICEMLQVGIDKASVVIPETLQQIVAWTLYKNATMSVMLVIIIAVLGYITISLLKKFVSTSKEFDDPTIIMYGVGVCVCFSALMSSSVYLLTESIPLLIKALVAPNLVIIEQLGGLVK